MMEKLSHSYFLRINDFFGIIQTLRLLSYSHKYNTEQIQNRSVEFQRILTLIKGNTNESKNKFI